LSQRQSFRITCQFVMSEFPAQIKDALFAAGLKAVGQVREISDEALLALPDFGTASVAYLRETLGGRPEELARQLQNSIRRLVELG
jgi:hypothetical protein